MPVNDMPAVPAPATAEPPLVSTRVRPPSLGSAFAGRARIDTLLDAALDDSTRLTLLSAPPGYGKSVAILGWIAARRLACAWLSLDAGDNDPARFVRYLAAALAAVRPGAGWRAASLFGPGSNPDPELVGATLLDEVSALDDPFVLVFDDYQAVVARPVHDLVRFLIERGPPFAHLVVATREDPPFPLARLRAHRRLVELRAGDLRYTSGEAEAFLASAGAALPEDRVERLVERTEGWVAGLQLAAISIASRPDAAGLVEAFGASHRFVLDYLADEVVAAIEPELRSFLVRTSIADRFSVELCRELTGREDADLLLARAERANLFLVPLDLDRRWYRYHHLFAGYLRLQLDEATWRELRGRAAGWLERAGLLEEAIPHALAAGELERAVRLVRTQARAAFDAGELSTLLDWLDALPPETVAGDGELTSMRAWALFHTGRLAEGVALAAARLASTPDRGAAEGRLLVLTALLETVTGPDAEAHAFEGLRLLGDDPFFRSLALQAAGLAQLARGEFPAAAATVSAAFDAALESGHPMVVLPATNPLVHGLNAVGRRSEAEAICRDVLERFGRLDGFVRPIAWYARLALGTLRYEANDLVEARRELEAGFDAALALGFARPALGWAIPYLALAREACGDREAALAAVRPDGRAPDSGTPLPGLSAETEARLLLAAGDVAGAARWADSAVPEAALDSPLVELLRVSMDVAVARVRLAQGRHAEARALVAPARSWLEQHAAVPDLVSARVVEAAAAAGLGDRSDALAALRSAVELAAPGGYVRRILDDGRPVVDLLPLVRSSSPAFVDAVLAAMTAETERGASDRARGSVWEPVPGLLLESLTARETDVLRLVATGASNAEIASGLGVSIGTAKWHVANVLAKLGVSSRTQALVRARQVGLV